MKCPHCKVPLKAHTKICADCGHTVRAERQKRQRNLFIGMLLLIRLLLSIVLVVKLSKQKEN